MGEQSFVHIINPINPPDSSDLSVAQPVTFETIKTAQEFASKFLNVELLAATYSEDANTIPKYFRATEPLTRSVLDTGNFQTPRKLPFLKDILERAYRESEADWVIYSNLDISVLPHFYSSVASFLDSGSDALIINRRTISSHWSETSDIPRMYAEVGKPHVGYDCFVFPRNLIPRLELGQVIIGAPFVGLVLALALSVESTELQLIEEGHLTFHIGDDRIWQGFELNDFAVFNKKEAAEVILRLEDLHGPFTESLPSWSIQSVNRIKTEVLGYSATSTARPTITFRLWRRLRQVKDRLIGSHH